MIGSDVIVLVFTSLYTLDGGNVMPYMDIDRYIVIAIPYPFIYCSVMINYDYYITFK